VVRIPYGELGGNNPTGGNGLANAANAARGAVCSLYRRYPRWLHGPAYSPGALVMRPFFDNLCDPPQQPPLPPSRPFTGGQCAGVSYRVVVAYKNSPGTSGSPQTLEGTDTFFLRGPIGRRYVRTASVQELQITHTDLTGAPRATTVIGTSNLQRVLEWVSFVVTRQDGGADTCGDPPIDYPDDQPPPGDLSFPVTIPVGGDSYTFPLIIPFIDLSPEFNLNPQINVQVGPFDFTFDLGGVNVGINPEINLPDTIPVGPDPRPPSGRPPTRPPIAPPGGGCPPCPDLDLTPVLQAVADIDADLELVAADVKELLDCDRCDHPTIDDPSLLAAQFPPATSGTYAALVKPRWVRVELTEQPRNARMQVGEQAADVIYAGWYSIGSGNAEGDRNAIRYENQVMPFPEGTNLFSFTLYAGYKARVTIYSQPEEE